MNEMVSLREIEIRIREHMNGIGLHMLAVGRCLNEAKEICPHGEWEAWVSRNTGMKLRTAQELMRAAREVPEGSYMEQLNMGMISKILTLPEGEREGIAKKAVDEGMTVKALRAEVDRLKDQNRQQVENNSRMNELRADAERKAEDLRLKLMDALSRPAHVEYVQDPNQAAEIERLKEDLAFAEEEAERYSDEAQNAKAELINFRLSGAPADASDARTTVQDIRKACQTFMAAAGVLPHMESRIGRLSPADKDELRMYVLQVAEWTESAFKALDTDIIELRAVR